MNAKEFKDRWSDVVKYESMFLEVEAMVSSLKTENAHLKQAIGVALKALEPMANGADDGGAEGYYADWAKRAVASIREIIGEVKNG